MGKVLGHGWLMGFCSALAVMALVTLGCGDATELPQPDEPASEVVLMNEPAATLVHVGAGEVISEVAAVAVPEWERLLRWDVGQANVLRAVGTGVAERRNDRVEMWVGVHTEGADYEMTGVELQELMAGVAGILESHGVAPEDIEIFRMLVRRVTAPTPRWVGSGLLRVYSDNPGVVSNVGAVIEAHYVDGAVDFLRFGFLVSDRFDLEREARGRAFADMEANARQLAAESGKSLGRLLVLSEPPFGEDGGRWDVGNGSGLNLDFVGYAGMPDWDGGVQGWSEVPVYFGKTEHEVEVQGVYLLLER